MDRMFCPKLIERKKFPHLKIEDYAVMEKTESSVLLDWIHPILYVKDVFKKGKGAVYEGE